MTWIESVDEKDAKGSLKEVYGMIRSSRGRVANLFKAQGLDPEALAAHLDLYLSLMFKGEALSRLQREMIAVAVSATNKCGYCVAHHSTALSRYVKDAELLSELGRDPRSSRLKGRERAMLDYSLKLTLDPCSVTKDDIDALRRVGMSDKEILRLVLISSYFNFVNRLASGLGVTLEDEGGSGYRY